ncbi:MAG: MFS transporter [Rickettsia endosymbiont of Ixodes persulcatus]|nr:MFS transporter [Rickettsia endosymbiont of Ixodes persulcatus]
MKADKKQLILIVLIVFIGFIGVALPYPIFAPMFLHPQQDGIVPISWQLTMRGMMLGVVLAVYPLGQFIASPILGAFSDTYGRKKLLLICLFGTTVGYLITALSIYLKSIPLLITSRFVTGVLEGNIAIARAMAADLSEVNKYRGFGLIGMATTFGYILGPLFGGALADSRLVSWFSFYIPFCFAALLSLLAFLVASFYLNQSLCMAKTQQASLIKPLNLLKRIQVLKKNKLLSHHLLVLFVLSLAVDTYYEFYPVYLAGQWKVTSGGIALFTLVLAIAVGMGDFFLVPFLSKYQKDSKTVTYFTFLLSLFIGLILLIKQAYYLYFFFFCYWADYCSNNNDIYRYDL